MKKEIFKGNRITLKFGNQKTNLQERSADLCSILNKPLEDVAIHLNKLNINIEEGIVPRIGAIGNINSIYIRDPNKNLIEISNY